MKKTFSIIIMVFACITGYCQTISYTSPNAESQRMLDSVKYVMPEFINGIVIFNSGEQAGGPLNINTIDQKVHFTDEKGQVMELTNNDQVSRVFIKGRTFLNSRYGFVEIYETAGDIQMGEVRKVDFFSEDKVGAMGSKSQATGGIQTVSSVQTRGGYIVDFEEQKKMPYIYRKTPFLFRKGLVQIVTKKNLIKCFPNKKEAIEQYFKEKGPDMENVQQVREMFTAIAGK